MAYNFGYVIVSETCGCLPISSSMGQQTTFGHPMGQPIGRPQIFYRKNTLNEDLAVDLCLRFTRTAPVSSDSINFTTARPAMSGTQRFRNHGATFAQKGPDVPMWRCDAVAFEGDVAAGAMRSSSSTLVSSLFSCPIQCPISNNPHCSVFIFSIKSIIFSTSLKAGRKRPLRGKSFDLDFISGFRRCLNLNLCHFVRRFREFETIWGNAYDSVTPTPFSLVPGKLGEKTIRLGTPFFSSGIKPAGSRSMISP